VEVYRVVEVVRLCAHCGRELRPGARKTQRFCDGRHRQAGYRRRRVAVPETRPRQEPRRGVTLRGEYLAQQRAEDPVRWLLDRIAEDEAWLAGYLERAAREDAAVVAMLAAEDDAAGAAIAALDRSPGGAIPRGADRSLGNSGDVL
jgi:hypothetical protein